MTTERVESGLRNYRIEFAREDSYAEIPDAPEFLKYSGTIEEFIWDVGDTVNERRGLGSADPVDFQKAVEDHSFEISYDLNKWLTSSGSANDAAYDGLVRDADNLLPNSHLILTREDKGGISAEQSVSGNSGHSTRIYTVARGGLVEEAEISGEADEVTVAQVTLSYLAQKARSYQIDQPSSDTEIAVQSTSANDTTQTVTIENEDGSNSIDLSLDGTTVVDSGADTFADIDAIELDAETEGNVEVYEYDAGGSAVSDQLAVINGSGEYDDMEGDLGVPAVGSGSRETEGSLPSDYQHLVGDAFQRNTATVPHAISSATLTVSNDIENVELADSIGMALYAGNREISLELTQFGEATSHDVFEEALKTTEASTTWSLDGGDLTVTESVLQDPGERGPQAEEAVMMIDSTYLGQGITVTEN